MEADRQFGVVVRLAPEFRNDLEQVANIKVGYQTPSGINAYIPLSELADISLDTGASYIYHERNQRFIPIKFSVRGRDLAGAVAEAQQRIAANVKLPIGYRIDLGRRIRVLQQAKKRLAIIVPISLRLIVVLLYGLFNSLRDSLLALAGIPFAIAGGLAGALRTGLDFSISAAIGFISLLGVSVMNGILIMTLFPGQRPAAWRRSTPCSMPFRNRCGRCLMMTLSACIGLLPAAISTGIGSQVQRPLATVIVGGMLIGPDHVARRRAGAAEPVPARRGRRRASGPAGSGSAGGKHLISGSLRIRCLCAIAVSAGRFRSAKVGTIISCARLNIYGP